MPTVPELDDELLELELELEEELVELLLELEDELDELLELELLTSPWFPPQANNKVETTAARDSLPIFNITQPFVCVDLLLSVEMEFNCWGSDEDCTHTSM